MGRIGRKPLESRQLEGPQRGFVSDFRPSNPRIPSSLNSYLHEAIENNFVEIVRILVVDGNADVDTKGGFGDPVLHGAIKKDAVEIVRILVNANADVNAEDRFGKSPLTRAQEGGNSQIIKILEDAGATE